MHFLIAVWTLIVHTLLSQPHFPLLIGAAAITGLFAKTPVFQSGGGDFTAVNDTTPVAGMLGQIYAFLDSSGRPRVIKYVTYNPTAAGSKAQGSPLYYKDVTRQVVTDNEAEAVTWVTTTCSALFAFAGILLNTAANTVATDGLWIQIGGFCDKVKAPASTVVGDILILSNAAGSEPTSNLFIRIPAGTDVTLVKSVFAVVFVLTALSGGFVQGWIQTPGETM